MQDQELVPRTGCDSIGTALVVTELYKRSLLVKLLHDRADLPTGKPLRGNVCQQRDDVQQGWSRVFRTPHSTQQVTNLGTCSPVRKIQIVFTTALIPCPRMVTSIRQRQCQAQSAASEGTGQGPWAAA